MKNNYQSKAVPRGTRTIWRYLSALILLFSLGIGQMWADETIFLWQYDGSTVYGDGSNNGLFDMTATTGTIKFVTYEKKKTSADGTSGYASSVTDNDLKPSITKVCKLGNNGAHLRISPASGNFKAGDVIYICGYSPMLVTTSTDPTSTAKITTDTGEGGKTTVIATNVATGTGKSACAVGTVTIPVGFTETDEIYISRVPSTSVGIAAIKVVRPAASSDPVPVTSITIDNVDNDAEFYVGDVVTFETTVEPSDATNKTLSWEVDDPSMGTITDAGVLTITAAGDFTVTASATDESGVSASVHLLVYAAPEVCPSGLAISGTSAYTEGQTISLTAGLAAGNGDITYTWYKGADFATAKAAGSIGTGTSFSKASCGTGDAGYYWCEASKEGCAEPAQNGSEFVVSVEAKTCPTSGVLFSLEFVNSAKVTMSDGDNLALTSTYATITGGSASIKYFKSGNTNKEVLTTGHLISYGTNDQYLKLNLDCPLAPGDKIELADGSGVEIALATDDATPKDATHKVITSSYTYTVVADDALDGQTVLYLGRSDATSSKHGVVTITRPYTVSYDNLKEASHTMPATAIKFTLEELTNATFEHTGWTADKAVKVGGETKAASTALAVDATVELTDNTTFTATWEAKVTKYTVTYYDGETELGTELVVEGENPTATGIAAPKKIGYTFAGWSTTNGGDATALSGITVSADMPLYAVYNAVNCNALSGKIFEVNINVAPAANCTIRSGSGYETSADLIKYGTVSGGIAIAENSSTSNHLIITTTPTVKFAGGNGYVHISFDCALKVGDKIKTTIASQNIAYTTTSSRSTTNYFTKGTDQELTITSGHALENATEIYLWAASSNGGELTSLQVIRPEKFEVTFNMHGHGDAVDPQSVVEGGKVSEPADPTASGWDFGGWFTDDTYGTYWDFENMTISSATEIHALWTEHTTSSDATLSSLTVNGEAITLEDGVFGYAFELPMGTTALPTIVAVANDPNNKGVSVLQTNIGSATITVTAEDDSFKVYTITFTVATSKDIQLVFKTGTTPCVGSASTATQILSNNAAVSTYINQITFTNVEGAGDDGAEGSSLNVGKKAGNMFTLSAKAGYAFQAMNFLAKIQDATCEYSINGGDWTELASTNTGDDECYAPFTSGTVHEFRLRSTGNSGVWIRNMQLTIIEACTPVAITWDEEPVEFEVGKAGYAIAATANNGGTIAYGSSDASVIAVDAGNGVLSVSDLGSVTLSASTAEGDGTTYCDNSGTDIVISKVVNTYFLVTLDAQNGDAPAEIKFHNGDAAIAEPAEPVYAGHTFDGWLDESDDPVVWPLTPTVSMALHASWTADCTAPTIDAQPASANYLTGRAAVALNCEATAAGSGALSYVWYSCDDELRTNPIELAGAPTPSTAAAGTFYFFCAVTEEGCANVANSNVAVITVTDKDAICLVKAELAAGSSAASITATSGAYKDDANIAININSDLKLGGTGKYVKVAVAGTNFQDGDVVEITLRSDKGASAWLQIFSDEGTTLVAEMTSGVSKDHSNYLTISGVPANTKTLYLYRTEAAGGNMNPYPTSMAVYRTCAPILNSVTVAGVEVAPDNTNHVTIEVPASTDAAALDAIAYDWVSNSDAWTDAHDPAVANTWEFGVENTVTFVDKDGDESVYYITISKAAASSDATLSSLTVNGQAIALADGVFNYSFELPYGTSVVPTVVATANHVAATATVDPCTLSGATITVVPESGAGDQQVYTLTFVISKWQEVVIWDGSTMSAVATSPDATTGFAWAVNGFSSITNYDATCGTKAYTKTLPSGGGASASRNVAFTVPAGYVAKFYIAFGTHSDGNNRGMFIGENATKTLDATSVLTLYSNSRTNLTDGTSEIVGAGTYYLNPMESVDFSEIRAYLRPGYARTAMLGNGVLGTVCVDHNVAVEDIQGVTVYELVGREPQYGKVAFDEIVSGGLEAGAPYVFQAHGDRMVLFFGDTKVDDPVDKGNGMYGTFVDQTLTELNDIYYFAQRALWSCVDLSSLSVPANRAYVKLSEIDYISDPNPAPGRRRVMMSVNGEQVATGMENVESDNVQSTKLLINGQLFILRGEKMYDATGRLVK